MLRQTRSQFFSPYKLAPRSQINTTGSRRVPTTVPTPIAGEVGGMYGVSIPYSDEMSRGASFEERMAKSTYSTRLQENATMYPMSPYREGEFDPRYLPTPYPDPMKSRPLLEVGEPDDIPREMKVPVIFLCDVKQDVSGFYKGENVNPMLPPSSKNKETSKQQQNSNKTATATAGEDTEMMEEGDEEMLMKEMMNENGDEQNQMNQEDSGEEQGGDEDDHTIAFKSSMTHEDESMIQARKYETHYVNQSFMRRKLQPQRLAVYATKENYRLLGLPERDLKIHAEIPRNRDDYEKLRSKHLWENERWRFSFEMLFRKYDQGPPELLDDAGDDWDGSEEVYTAGSGGAGDGRGGKAGGKTGPAIKRKAKKIKLF